MSINQLLQQAEAQQHVIIPEGWGQGRATYGGLIAGLLLSHLNSVLGDFSHERVLRSATISFVAAATSGKVEFASEVFRNGKSVTQASARLIQHGEVVAVLLASFGSSRASAIQVNPIHAAPAYQRPDALQTIPYIAGVLPEFFQQTNLRWASGHLPFSGANQPDFGGWMRWNDSFPQMTVAHLLALIDGWPPSVFPMFKGPSFGSTLCWTVEFLTHSFEQSSDNWWQYQVTTDAADSGYAHSEARIWDDEGKLVAISRQTVTIFV